MEEIWKKIIVNGIPTQYYYISNFGNIKNKKTGRTLNGNIFTNGYLHYP